MAAVVGGKQAALTFVPNEADDNPPNASDTEAKPEDAERRNKVHGFNLSCDRKHHRWSMCRSAAILYPSGFQTVNDAPYFNY
jgi:hypothetical protein